MAIPFPLKHLICVCVHDVSLHRKKEKNNFILRRTLTLSYLWFCFNVKQHKKSLFVNLRNFSLITINLNLFFCVHNNRSILWLISLWVTTVLIRPITTHNIMNPVIHLYRKWTSDHWLFTSFIERQLVEICVAKS